MWIPALRTPSLALAHWLPCMYLCIPIYAQARSAIGDSEAAL